MKHYVRTALLTSFLLSVASVPAMAQRRDALRVGAVGVTQSREGERLVTMAPIVAPADAPPARWPFVLAGALIGGLTAGAWYGHEVAKSEDPMIDLSFPVVGIGIGAGAFVGFIVAEAVRAAHSPARETQ